MVESNLLEVRKEIPAAVIFISEKACVIRLLKSV